MSAASGDFEGAIGGVGKNQFEFVGVLGVTDAIAEQHHAVFEITGLPGVEEVVGGGEGEHVTGIGRSRLRGRMGVRTRPSGGRQEDGIKDCEKEEKSCDADLHALVFVILHSGPGMADSLLYRKMSGVVVSRLALKSPVAGTMSVMGDVSTVGQSNLAQGTRRRRRSSLANQTGTN